MSAQIIECKFFADYELSITTIKYQHYDAAREKTCLLNRDWTKGQLAAHVIRSAPCLTLYPLSKRLTLYPLSHTPHTLSAQPHASHVIRSAPRLTLNPRSPTPLTLSAQPHDSHFILSAPWKPWGCASNIKMLIYVIYTLSVLINCGSEAEFTAKFVTLLQI